jgi:hypothetical protein
VPLLSQAYWASDWCTEEYKTAERLEKQGRLTIVPYFLDDEEGPLVPAQRRRLSHLPFRQQIARVVQDLDEYLVSADPTG